MANDGNNPHSSALALDEMFSDAVLEQNVLSALAIGGPEEFFRRGLPGEAFAAKRKEYDELRAAFESGYSIPAHQPPPPDFDLDQGVAELLELAKKREAAEIAASLLRSLASRGVEEAVELARKRLAAVSEFGVENAAVCSSALDLAAKAEAELIRRRLFMRSTGRPSPHPTFGPNLPSFTVMFDGLQPGIWVLGGEPGLGKTFLALFLVHRYLVAEDDTCALWVDALETRPSWLIALKLACIHAKTSPWPVERAKVDENEMRRLFAAFRDAPLSRRFAVFQAGAESTMSDIRAAARRLMSSVRCGRCMIVIDYVQKLAHFAAGGDLPDTRQKAIKVVADASTLVDGAANGPVLLISSLSKDAYRRNVKDGNVADFKEAGEVEYTADTGIILRWAKDERNGNPGSAVKALDAWVVKNRWGPGGVVKLFSNRNTAEYTETDPGFPALALAASSRAAAAGGADSGADAKSMEFWMQ